MSCPAVVVHRPGWTGPPFWTPFDRPEFPRTSIIAGDSPLPPENSLFLQTLLGTFPPPAGSISSDALTYLGAHRHCLTRPPHVGNDSPCSRLLRISSNMFAVVVSLEGYQRSVGVPRQGHNTASHRGSSVSFFTDWHRLGHGGGPSGISHSNIPVLPPQQFDHLRFVLCPRRFPMSLARAGYLAARTFHCATARRSPFSRRPFCKLPGAFMRVGPQNKYSLFDLGFFRQFQRFPLSRSSPPMPSMTRSAVYSAWLEAIFTGAA